MKRKNRMSGRVTYKIYKMKKSEMKNVNVLHKHDEVLYMLSKWFSFQKSTENIALDTNYPWVFKSKSEIIMDVNEYKTLVIPPFSIFGPKTMGKFRMSILNDKYAHINELKKLLKPKCPLSNKISKLIFGDDSKRLDKYFHRLIEYLAPLCQMNGVSDEKGDTIRISKNKYFSTVPNMNKYETLNCWIEDRINKNIHFVSVYKDFMMNGNLKFISLFQVKFRSYYVNKCVHFIFLFFYIICRDVVRLFEILFRKRLRHLEVKFSLDLN